MFKNNPKTCKWISKTRKYYEIIKFDYSLRLNWCTVHNDGIYIEKIILWIVRAQYGFSTI